MRSPKKFGVLSCEVSQGLGYSCICFLCAVHEAGIKLASSEKTLELVIILEWPCFLEGFDLFRVCRQAGLGENGANTGQ